MMLLGLGLALGVTAITSSPDSLFTDSERQAVVKYWSEPGRYSVRLPDAALTEGCYQVRLTVAGSIWLREYNRKRGLNKVPPTTTAQPQNEEQRGWQVWIDAKIERDRWIAAQSAIQENRKEIGHDGKLDDKTLPFSEPADPGAAPKALVSFAGDPPPFAEVVRPMLHEITFPDGTKVSFKDNVRMRKNYAYYRFEKGVASDGIPVRAMPAEKVDALFAKAGVTPSEARVMKAVSLLEGGFEAINTYDTGYVTAGFIQFATLKDGGNSLGDMLLQYKREDPEDFNLDFRRYGIDVTEDAKLACVDPSSGDELTGEKAVLKVIEDRRLIAVFEYDGLKSEPYNIEQIRSAKAQFYPGSDPVKVEANGVTLSGRVDDIVKSEAGLATLMDRKVNTGHIDSTLVGVLLEVANANGISRFEDFAPFEYDIVLQMKYRRDFLADQSLSQPSLAVRSKPLGSRNGGRSGRGSGGGTSTSRHGHRSGANR